MKEHIKGKMSDSVGVPGIVTATVLEPKTEREHSLVAEMRRNRSLLKIAEGAALESLFARNHEIELELKETCKVREVTQKNIVCTAGLTQITKGLSTNLTALSEIQVNYAAVGTGSTTPVAGDTTLTTESFRNSINTLNYSNGTLFASMFIDYTEDSGTYYEAGIFINGTGTTDSGSLLDHVLLNAPSGITKSTSQILTISFQITFTPV